MLGIRFASMPLRSCSPFVRSRRRSSTPLPRLAMQRFYATYNVKVNDMKCAGCVGKVQKALETMGTSVTVNLLTKQVSVESSAPLQEVIRSIEQVGFHAEPLKPPSVIHLKVDGMHCASCTNKVKQTLLGVGGVMSADVNLLLGTVIVETSKPNHLRDLLDPLTQLGYSAAIQHSSGTSTLETRQKQEEDEYQQRLKQAGWIAVPAFIVSMVCGMWLGKPEILQQEPSFLRDRGITWSDIIMLALATPVQFYIALPFHRSAIKSLSSGISSANMDVLVSLGTSCSYFYSVALLMQRYNSPPKFTPESQSGKHRGHSNYFESTIFLVTFILLGKFIEAKSKTHTTASIRALASLQPESATIVPSGRVFPVEMIQPQDLLQVSVGARFPADGYVVKGKTFVDESLLTGEPLPRSVQPDSDILAGTVNQGPEAVEFLVTKVGRESTLQRILGLVEAAQTKPPSQQLADSISSVFVPSIIALSAADFLLWTFVGASHPEWIPAGFTVVGWAVNCAISTLVIACPCALGLATPTAVMVATGLAAQRGILLRGGSVLEECSKVDTVVWDKTGTLTSGKPSVVEVEQEFDDLQMWARVRQVESRSMHPLAMSLIEYIDAVIKPPELSNASLGNLQELAGRGMIANDVIIGNADLLKEYGIAVKSSANVYIGITKPTPRLFASVTFGDQLRNEAHSAIQQLSALNVSSWIVSGDSKDAVSRVAESLGIPSAQTIAAVDPIGKQAALDSIPGAKAFVGDGINDSIVLASANVGVALPTSAIAMDSAPVVLTRANLALVPQLISLSRASMATIRRNFAWAFAYNIVCVPIAAGIHVLHGGGHGLMITPEMAGLAMGLSSVSVVLSSLWLRRWK